MCGIVGFLRSGQLNFDSAKVTLSAMSNAILNRGPDDYGYWFDDKSSVGLGHRRLAIVDLSSAGRQPMVSFTGRYILVFNGEIYNHLELRTELAGSLDAMTGGSGAYEHQKHSGGWQGTSDTETMLTGFEAWGVEETVRRCVGMFAFAVWDRKHKTLILGRDRLGEKPLYYTRQKIDGDNVFLFGSVLKAIREYPGLKPEINRDALCLLMRYSYIPAPYTIYKNISKLEPGCLLTVSAKQLEPLVNRYWSPFEVAKKGLSLPFVGTVTNAIDALEASLKQAVGQQMIADVPSGAFLSGGIDSSIVVALMQAQSPRPIKTFTIGFSDVGYNEAQHARAVALHLGTDHTEFYVSAKQALDVIPNLPEIYCEPFSDSSQIPTYLVSQVARKQVTVALSGDGGDELFAGYNRYVFANRLKQYLLPLPLRSRRLLAQLVRSVEPRKWDYLGDLLNNLISPSNKINNMGDKLFKMAEVVESKDIAETYLKLISHWQVNHSIVIGGIEPLSMSVGSIQETGIKDFILRMMLLDTVNYLPGDILTKVDRAAMGVSLEGRMPFLDHRLVELAWSFPVDLKIRDGVSKWILREVLYRHVPKRLIDRPKMGFGVPIDRWLRGPLRDWAESLINKKRLDREGYFSSEPIRKKWVEHISGTRNWQYHLWDVLMFQSWLEVNHPS